MGGYGNFVAFVTSRHVASLFSTLCTPKIRNTNSFGSMSCLLCILTVRRSLQWIISITSCLSAEDFEIFIGATHMARPHLSLLKHQEVAIAYPVGLCHANWCNSSSSALSKNPHVLPPYWESQLYKVRALVSSIRSYEPTLTVKSHSFIHMLRSSMCWHYVRSIEAQSFDSNCDSQPPLWGRIQSCVYEGAIWHEKEQSSPLLA